MIKEVGDEDVNYRKLISKRIDGTMFDSVSATMKINDLGMTRKIVPYFDVLSEDGFVLFSKKSVSKPTIEAFNASLSRLRANGTYDEIVNRYYGL